MMKTIEQEKIEANIPKISLETCERAFYNISFSPEKRGKHYHDSYYAFAYTIARKVREAAEGGTDKMKEKSIWLEEYYLNKWHDLFTDYINKTSRCISSAITGPANFPTRRAEKRNGYRDNASQALYEFENTLDQRIKKAMLKTYTTKERAEMELEKKTNKIKRLEELSALYKELNKLSAKAIKNPELLKDIDFMLDVPSNCQEEFKHRVNQGYKFCHGFELTSLRNKIKQAQKMVDKLTVQLEAIEEQEESGEDEAQPIKFSESFSYLKNVAEDRLQLFFNFKPEPEIRSILKKHGFRWSPKFQAWQRQLTNNALYTFKTFVLANEDFKKAMQG